VFLLLWSGGYTGVKVGLTAVEPVFLLALRYVVVLAVLIPAFLLVRPRLPSSPRSWLHLAVTGLLVQGLYFGSTNVAIKLGASAVGLGIVLAMQPILVALLSQRLVGEAVTRAMWLGLALGLVGAVIAILSKARTGEATISGLVVAAIALIFITAGTLYEKRFGEAHHPIVANGVQCTVALAFALPLAMATESLRIDWSWAFVASLAYLSIANSLIATSLLFAMIRRGAAARASALFFLVPPTSAAIAAVILGEGMPPAAWIGMALAAAGVAIVRRP
jgi:drug/metabolite transporter (DMT)-like permease